MGQERDKREIKRNNRHNRLSGELTFRRSLEACFFFFFLHSTVMAMPNNYSNCLYPMVKILYISYYVLLVSMGNKTCGFNKWLCKPKRLTTVKANWLLPQAKLQDMQTDCLLWRSSSVNARRTVVCLTGKVIWQKIWNAQDLNEDFKVQGSHTEILRIYKRQLKEKQT